MFGESVALSSVGPKISGFKRRISWLGSVRAGLEKTLSRTKPTQIKLCEIKPLTKKKCSKIAAKNIVKNLRQKKLRQTPNTEQLLRRHGFPFTILS